MFTDMLVNIKSLWSTSCLHRFCEVSAAVVVIVKVNVYLSDVHGELVLCLTALVTQWTNMSWAVVFGVLKKKKNTHTLT